MEAFHGISIQLMKRTAGSVTIEKAKLKVQETLCKWRLQTIMAGGACGVAIFITNQWKQWVPRHIFAKWPIPYACVHPYHTGRSGLVKTLQHPFGQFMDSGARRWPMSFVFLKKVMVFPNVLFLTHVQVPLFSSKIAQGAFNRFCPYPVSLEFTIRTNNLKFCVFILF